MSRQWQLMYKIPPSLDILFFLDFRRQDVSPCINGIVWQKRLLAEFLLLFAVFTYGGFLKIWHSSKNLKQTSIICYCLDTCRKYCICDLHMWSQYCQVLETMPSLGYLTIWSPSRWRNVSVSQTSSCFGTTGASKNSWCNPWVGNTWRGQDNGTEYTFLQLNLQD